MKVIKFVAPSKLALNSKDDFMTKIKPVFGQNQINLVTFLAEFNKKTSFLKDDTPIEVSVKLKRLADKTFTLSVDPVGAKNLKNSWPTNNPGLSTRHLQDILLFKKRFGSKTGSQPVAEKTQASILLSNFRASGIRFDNE